MRRINDLEVLEKATRPGGTLCPTCEKHVQIYPRKFNSDMARVLVYTYKFFKAHPAEYLHVSNWLVENESFRSADYAKLTWTPEWGLLEKCPDDPPREKSSTGLYRMTSRGFLFTENRLRVKSHAREYQSEVIEFYGEDITIVQALPRHFNYAELMSGQPDFFR